MRRATGRRAGGDDYHDPMVKIGEDLFDYRYLGRMFDAMRALGAGEIEAYQSKDDRIGSIAVFVGQGAHGKITGLVMPVHRGHHADVKTQVKLFGEERNAGEWRPSANWTAATNKAIQDGARKLKRKGTKFAHAIVGGEEIGVATRHRLTVSESKDEMKVREVLDEVVGKEFEQLGETKLVKVSPAFVSEFLGSTYSQKLRSRYDKLWRAKVSSVPILKDILGTTALGPKEAAKHLNKQFKNEVQFYRCNTKFGVLRHDGVAVYPCELLIMESKASGERFVYDIVKIQKPTLTANDNLDEETLRQLKGWTRTGESATDENIIPNSGPKSQARFSQRFNPARADIRFSIGGLYTGSAADYDKPSLHYVGTGEGAQVYGWGLYGSSVRGVAEGYAKSNAEAYSEQLLRAHNGDRTKAVEEALRDYNEAYMARSGNAETFRQTLEILQGERKPEQHLYEQTFFTNRATGDEKGGEDEQVQNRFQFTPVVRRATWDRPANR